MLADSFYSTAMITFPRYSSVATPLAEFTGETTGSLCLQRRSPEMASNTVGRGLEAEFGAPFP
jgi:hypothetical protein